MKTGLVLEGGALRGLFSAGVIDVMMENGVKFDGLVGVSAGAAFGCNYKSRQAGRAIRYNTRFANDWRYCSWRSWLTTGDLFGGEFCYHVMPEELDIFDTAAFDSNPMEYYAVCTDVETGEPVYQKLMKCAYDTYEYIRASASMPLVSKVAPSAFSMVGFAGMVLSALWLSLSTLRTPFSSRAFASTITLSAVIEDVPVPENVK